MNFKKLIHSHQDGSPWGIVSIEQLWANIYALKYNKPEMHLTPEIWSNLFTEAINTAKQWKAETIICRVRKDYDHKKLNTVIQNLGFRKKSERIEYQVEVVKLPDDSCSPIIWKTAGALNWSTKQIAELTQKVIEGAYDIEPGESAETFIQDWLQNDELTQGLECISIGFINDKPCCLVVAQVENASGWSRITYMGIIPEFRNKKLGQWVHRRGFQMMKEQGGKIYHGGTNAKNIPMRNLFTRHNCQVLWEMEEWHADV